MNQNSKNQKTMLRRQIRMVGKSILVIAVVSASFSLMPAVTRACDTQERNMLNQGKISFAQIEKEAQQEKRHDIRTADCLAPEDMPKAMRTSEASAADETARGIFQYDIDKGHNQIEAFVFNINEEESRGASALGQHHIRQFNIDEE